MITHLSSSRVSSKRAAQSVSRNSMAISLAALLALGGAFGGGSALAADQAFVDDALTQDAIISSGAHMSGTSVPAVELPADKKPNPWLIGGAMALIMGALIKLVGPNRVMNMAAKAGPVLQKTAETIANAPKAAAKAVGSAISSPLRFLLLVGGLAMIGFTGISIFDLQWGAGIATGIGMTAVTWAGSSSLARQMKKVRIKVPTGHFGNRRDQSQ